jgi:hypothetical protein
MNSWIYGLMVRGQPVGQPILQGPSESVGIVAVLKRRRALVNVPRAVAQQTCPPSIASYLCNGATFFPNSKFPNSKFPTVTLPNFKSSNFQKFEWTKVQNVICSNW